MKTAKKPVNRVAKYGAGGFLCDNRALTPDEQATLRRMAHSKNYHARKRCAEWLKGVCVLEHILERDFTEYFGRARILIEGGNLRFAYTLAYAGTLGEAKEPQNIEEYNAFFATLPSDLYKSLYISPSQSAV